MTDRTCTTCRHDFPRPDGSGRCVSTDEPSRRWALAASWDERGYPRGAKDCPAWIAKIEPNRRKPDGGSDE